MKITVDVCLRSKFTGGTSVGVGLFQFEKEDRKIFIDIFQCAEEFAEFSDFSINEIEGHWLEISKLESIIEETRAERPFRNLVFYVDKKKVLEKIKRDLRKETAATITNVFPSGFVAGTKVFVY